MWFVLILESQDGKNGRQEERQHGEFALPHPWQGICSGLLSQVTNRTQGHHLRNGGITSAVGVLALPRGDALVVLPHGNPSVAVPSGGVPAMGGRAGQQGQVLSMGLAKAGCEAWPWPGLTELSCLQPLRCLGRCGMSDRSLSGGRGASSWLKSQGSAGQGIVP